jgi:hypothetical protein
MDTPTEAFYGEYQEPRTPYDDSALGVECAWPGAEFDLLTHGETDP